MNKQIFFDINTKLSYFLLTPRRPCHIEASSYFINSYYFTFNKSYELKISLLFTEFLIVHRTLNHLSSHCVYPYDGYFNRLTVVHTFVFDIIEINCKFFYYQYETSTYHMSPEDDLHISPIIVAIKRINHRSLIEN